MRPTNIVGLPTLCGLALLTLAVPPALQAQKAREPLPPPPLARQPAPSAGEAEAPPSLAEEEGVQPEVTIIQRRDAIVEEYRLNGELYRIRVIPRWGPPYYLVRTGADGVWKVELDQFAPITPPQWLLFSW